jgi:hypothetical protein
MRSKIPQGGIIYFNGVKILRPTHPLLGNDKETVRHRRLLSSGPQTTRDDSCFLRGQIFSNEQQRSVRPVRPVTRLYNDAAENRGVFLRHFREGSCEMAASLRA